MPAGRIEVITTTTTTTGTTIGTIIATIVGMMATVDVAIATSL